MQKVKLGCHIIQIRGVSYKPEDVYETLSDDSVILLRANNIKDGKINFDDVVYVNRLKVKSEQFLKKGDILICTSSGSKELVGKAAYITADYDVVFGAFCKVLRSIDICAEYLGHYFQSDYYKGQIMRSCQGANINNLRAEHFNELLIKLPLTEEKQKAIAKKLDKVVDLIEKRKKQIEKLDELVRSRFVEMFGDINKWGVSTIGEQFDVCSGGTPSTSEIAFWNNGKIPWVGSNVCQNKVLYKNDGKFITEEGLAHSSAKWILQNSVLIALVGATIGKAALLKFNTTTNQNVAAIKVFENSSFNAEFIFYLMQMQYDKFMELGGGKFKMANLSFIKNLPCVCPPIELQNKFAEFVEKVEKTKSVIKKSLSALETLKKSLMQKYFG